MTTYKATIAAWQTDFNTVVITSQDMTEVGWVKLSDNVSVELPVVTKDEMRDLLAERIQADKDAALKMYHDRMAAILKREYELGSNK